LGHLLYHVREYYWLDINRLNEIYRYKGEEWRGSNEQVQYLPRLDSYWLTEWLPEQEDILQGTWELDG